MIRGKTTAKKGLHRFVRENWFKLLLVLIALYIFFQKDLSFQLHFRSPIHQDTEKEPPALVEPAGKREKLTLRKGGEKRDRFDLSSAFNSTRKGLDMYPFLEQVSEDKKLAYLKRFARVAIVEQKKYGIPASIILSSALLHSTAGEANWAVSGNNHFALLCTENWTGESGQYEGSCFRHYESAWSSFRDNSMFLNEDWNEVLPFSEEADYQVWAAAMAQGPYQHESGVKKALITLIETYQLYELDDELP